MFIVSIYSEHWIGIFFFLNAGAMPFSSTQYKMEKFRCNACGPYFITEAPDDVLADGDKRQRYC